MYVCIYVRMCACKYIYFYKHTERVFAVLGICEYTYTCVYDMRLDIYACTPALPLALRQVFVQSDGKNVFIYPWYTSSYTFTYPWYTTSYAHIDPWSTSPYTGMYLLFGWGFGECFCSLSQHLLIPKSITVPLRARMCVTYINVCMHACMYVCRYVCMYVCVCVFVCVCVCIQTHSRLERPLH